MIKKISIIIIGILIIGGLNATALKNSEKLIQQKTLPNFIKLNYQNITEDKQEKISNTIHEWTLLVYFCADNDLSNALEDFEFFSGDHLNVVVLNDNKDQEAEILYYDTSGNTKILQELGEVNTGDPDTLYNFISYGTQNYPANHYLLYFFGHGGGWRGACPDESSSNDMLTMDEIQQALKSTHKMDIICFQSCLMGAIEAAYELKDLTDVYIGCEEATSVWQHAIDEFCTLLNNKPNLSNYDIGAQFIDFLKVGHPSMPNYSKKYPTYSAIKTESLDALVDAINALSCKLLENTSNYDTIFSALEMTKKFGDWEDYDERLLLFIDIYDFTKQYISIETNEIIKQDLQLIQDEVNNSVLSEWHGSEQNGSHGLTIYFPKTAVDYDYDNNEFGLDFTDHTSWDELLLHLTLPKMMPNVDQFQLRSSIFGASYLSDKWMFAQSFIPTCDILTKMKFLVENHGVVNADLTVSIKKTLDGTDLITYSISSEDIIKNAPINWIECDFNDIQVIPGETYYIQFIMEKDKVLHSYYIIGGNNDKNSYEDGDVYFKNTDANWIKWTPKFDFCFITYGGHSAPQIEGSRIGKYGVEYQYSFEYQDPHGSEEVYYLIDWGDEKLSDWQGPYTSGELLFINHSWNDTGTYELKAKCKNTNGIESEWSEPLQIRLTKNKIDLLSMLNSYIYKLNEFFRTIQSYY